MKVLTFARHFPAGHCRKGEPTYFVEQILNAVMPRGVNGIIDRNAIDRKVLDIINDFVILDGRLEKHHTIRAGARFKPGDMASLRVWSNKPYRSKQIEFAQVEVKKVWVVRIEFSKDIIWVQINGGMRTYAFQNELAKNDGLELQDFIDWFKGHPKKGSEVFTGQIICWSPHITY